eukprot:gene26243-34864_t
MNYLWNHKIHVENLPDDNEIDSVFGIANANFRNGSNSLDVKSISLAFFRRLKPWHWACMIGWTIFIIFQIVYGYNTKFSPHPWCSKEHDGLQEWYLYLCFGNTGGFLIIWVILIARFHQAKHSRLGNLDRYLAYLNVVTIGLISSVLMLTSGWGKFCIDYFGVTTPAVIWGEWFAAGPIIFIVISTTIVEKPQMDRVDWVLVASFTLTILFGFLVVFATNLTAAIIYLALSYLFNMPLFFLPCILNLTLPLFGLTYLLAATGVLSVEATVALFQVFSMAIKGLYGAILVNLEADAANGLTASKVLREFGFANLIVGVTGNVLEDDVREFMAMGADIVLSKPINLVTLQAIVRFMEAEGFTSKAGLTLVDKGNRFEWVDSSSSFLAV